MVTEIQRIYAAQPQYAGGCPQSHRQFWIGASRKYAGRLTLCPGGGSLLANGFNQLWCHALNLRNVYYAGKRAAEAGLDKCANPFTKGDPGDFYENWASGYSDGSGKTAIGPITHFAMLHDDVVPDTGWLDVLLDAQQQCGADVVGAVVPIKDGLGLSSTAIDDPADIFHVERRLTMTEVHRLPPTFTAADCGYPDRYLLLNTGCWVADITKPWAIARDERGLFKVLFTIMDAITTVTARDGTEQYMAQVAPEDWNFSRLVQQAGGSVAATRLVRLKHLGMFPYPSDVPWGEYEYDKNLGDKFGHKAITGTDAITRVVEEVKKAEASQPEANDPTVSEVMSDVSGWMTDLEGRALADLAVDKRVLEVGSYQGRSTIWLGRTATSVFCVDTFDGRSTAHPFPTLELFKRNVERYGVRHKIKAVQGESVDILNRLKPGSFDLVFIDGDHNCDAVRADLCAALPLLAGPGSRIVFHDYGSKGDPGVKWVVDDYLQFHPTVNGQLIKDTMLFVMSFPEGVPQEQNVTGGFSDDESADCEIEAATV